MTDVLLVRLSAIGDVVQSLGAVRALAVARPDLQLHFLVQDGYQDLLQGQPVRSVLRFERRGGLAGLRRLRAALAAVRPAVALDLQGNWKSAWLCALSGARQRLGAAGPWRQEPWSRVLLSRTVRLAGPRHPARVAAALVRELAPDAPGLRPELPWRADEVARAAAAVAAAGADPGRPLRVVVPGDPADPRSLRPELLPREVADSPHPVLFLLGPDEAHLPPPAGAPVLRHGRGDLRQLVGIGGLLVQNGGDAVGPDQGPSHVLAATGVPTRVLFGPQDPAATAPPAATVLRHPAPPACAPCRRRRCHHAEGPVCMAFASVGGVSGPPVSGAGIDPGPPLR